MSDTVTTDGFPVSDPRPGDPTVTPAIPDLFSVAVLATMSVQLALAAICYARARVHARRAVHAAMLARADRADARNAADRARMAATHRMDTIDPPEVRPVPVRDFDPKPPKLFAPDAEGTGVDTPA